MPIALRPLVDATSPPPVSGRPSLRRVAEVPPAVIEQCVEDARVRLRLTPQQAEVLSEVVCGLGNKEIAGELGCAENTVEFHLTSVMRKAGVQTRVQLIVQFWTRALQRAP